MAHAQETPTSGPAVFKSETSDVRVDVEVTDGKHPIQTLTRDDFTVSDNGQPQNIVYFGHDREKLALILLLDVSGSMQPHVEQLAAKAREALSVLRPGDRVAIMVFGKRSEIHQDFSDNIAESARQIPIAIHGHDVGAGTAINAAIADAADYMRQNAGDSGRRAILIVTDNLCLNYKLNDDDVIRALYGVDATLNAIVIGRGIRPGPPKAGVYVNPDFTPADVFHLAEATGGEAVRADHPGLTFEEMVEHIRTRYLLAYHAPGGEPGSLRHIGVALTADALRRYPSAQVHARSGYYVPGV